MGKLNLQLTNNKMNLEVIVIMGNDALLKRLNDSSFIVCRNIVIHNDFTCEWGHAIGYFESYDKAYQCFIEDVVRPFEDYMYTLEEDICSDEDFEGMTLEDLTGIPSSSLY